MEKNILLRSIPKVDLLLKEERIRKLSESCGYGTVLCAVRTEQEKLRAFIASSEDEKKAEELIAALTDNIIKAVKEDVRPRVVRVLNGTGTILHTNLGRAPLGRAHMEHLAEIGSGYCNLEYDLDKGRRGERYSHFEDLLCRITGAEAAMAVNNNAAAVLLVLSTMASGGEAIVSRGELVEVGGKFRIPDVMALSGAVLREVGTTNKTRLCDYEDAVNENTKVFMKVHTSNYRVVGFTESAGLKELISLRDKYGFPVIEDLGSGALVDFSGYGLTYEPTVQESIKNGADVVCFSGDKLLGGPQAGIIAGKKVFIEKMKKNQLTRALRIDKFTAAALEAVLRDYLSEELALKNIPVLRMITRPACDVKRDAQEFCGKLIKAGLKAQISAKPCRCEIGGGSFPNESIESFCVAIKPREITTACLEQRLRRLEIPVVGRVADDGLILDMRTFDADYEDYFVNALSDGRILEQRG